MELVERKYYLLKDTPLSPSGSIFILEPENDWEENPKLVYRCHETGEGVDIEIVEGKKEWFMRVDGNVEELEFTVVHRDTVHHELGRGFVVVATSVFPNPDEAVAMKSKLEALLKKNMEGQSDR